MDNQYKAGFSLLEVMVAILVLAALVLGSSALVYRVNGGIQLEQNKREAIISADSVMEFYWNKSYDDLRDNFSDQSIVKSVTVNGRSMTATIALSAEMTDSSGDNYIEISVDVDHRGTANDIVLVTRRYPFGIGRAPLEP